MEKTNIEKRIQAQIDYYDKAAFASYKAIDAMRKFDGKVINRSFCKASDDNWGFRVSITETVLGKVFRIYVPSRRNMECKDFEICRFRFDQGDRFCHGAFEERARKNVSSLCDMRMEYASYDKRKLQAICDEYNDMKARLDKILHETPFGILNNLGIREYLHCTAVVE